MKVRYHGNYGYAGTNFDDVEEFPDDYTEEDIVEDLTELVMQQVSWDWEIVEE